MHGRLRKCCAHALFALVLLQPASAGTQEELYRQIEKAASRSEVNELQRLANKFFRMYPDSRPVPDIRLMLAESEANPEKAIHSYRILIEKYRYFRKRDFAHYKICEILYLSSRWEDLREEARRAIQLYKSSRHAVQFKFFLAKAAIHLQRYAEAKEVAEEIAGTDHDYQNLAEAVLLLAYINKAVSGYSRPYLKSMKEMIIGFEKSAIAPSAIYLLGSYYERKRDYDRAYSAYRDIIERFPGSPESEYASQGMSRLAQFNPRTVQYMPDDALLQRADEIDIQPEYDITDSRPNRRDDSYSISLGPFSSIEHAREIKSLVKKHFRPVEIVKLKDTYVIYVGRSSKPESALSIKIRLAEEFGLNGRIVRIVKKMNRNYIYGE